VARLWRRVTHIGVTPGLPATEAKYVIVNNILVVFMTLVAVMTTALSYGPILATRHAWLSAAMIVQPPLMLVALVFAARGHAFLSALWFGMSAAWLLIFQAWIVGLDTHIHLYFFMHAVLPFGIVPERYGRRLLCMPLIFLAAFLFALLGLPAQPVVDVGSTTRQVLAVMNPLLVFLSLAVFGYYERLNTLAAEREVQQERLRAEHLLLNILPAEIAERLKRDDSAIADGFAEVTVLFADIAGFTQMADKLPPARLVAMLNEVFSQFDGLAERHGLEKIKTIGDAYMAAAGLPQPRSDHAEAVADMALDMLQVLAAMRSPLGLPLAMRIGIHTGPVVAGVIGKRKFIYDLWGDTVNIAARMESHGEAGQIQVSAETARRLQATHVLEDRGLSVIKGKGELQTFWLTGRKAAGV
jgi:class 3 adenylate cyclase